MQANRAHGFSARRAFTLIELLVVISIIGLMTGLIVAGAMKFKDAARDNAADAQVSRLQTKLRSDYGEVVQKCHREGAPNAILTYCGGDRDRALAVHTAATLRVHFPETFAEATTPFSIMSGATAIYTYDWKRTFKPVETITGSDHEMRAVLLHLMLSERATAGGTGDDSGATGEQRVVKVGGKDFTVFIDSFGTPLTYYRWAQNSELDQPPYSNRKSNNASDFIDPLDPKGLMGSWASTSGLGLGFATPGNASHNRVPTVVSAGKNRAFDTLGASGTDDRVGYRLDRLGNKGDKK